ncbi:MAG: type III pantothenate kinase [Acidobacteria bacterium]|nr:type III pantothenate kinase [Acidobacteriota bacterium]
MIVDSTFDFGLKVAADPPSNAGTDRLVAASSAVRKYGKPCIVYSFGTATTVDAVNSKGPIRRRRMLRPGSTLSAKPCF